MIPSDFFDFPTPSLLDFAYVAEIEITEQIKTINHVELCERWWTRIYINTAPRLAATYEFSSPPRENEDAHTSGKVSRVYLTICYLTETREQNRQTPYVRAIRYSHTLHFSLSEEKRNVVFAGCSRIRQDGKRFLEIFFRRKNRKWKKIMTNKHKFPRSVQRSPTRRS